MTIVSGMASPEMPTSTGLLKIKEAAFTQSGVVGVRQQVEVSSYYSSPKLTASVNENSLRDWRKHTDGFAGKRYKDLEKGLTVLPDSKTFISVPDIQTLGTG